MLSSLSHAEKLLCPKVLSQGEGNWPISESTFTEAAAKEALNKLQIYISLNAPPVDTVIIDNELLMVRGYILKARAGEGLVGSKDDFCRFIKESAYLQH